MENNKYHNSKIYKLVSDNTDKIYIGSTVQSLYKRIHGHKGDYKKFNNNGIKYVSSYELIVLGNIDIILIEKFKCESKEELHARERYHIELNKELCVNFNIPSRTIKEWYIDNNEIIKKKRQDYKKNNKEKIKEQHKEYIKNNKEKIKEYNNNNIEKMREYKKKYRENNINKLKEKFNCECGGKYTYSTKSTHLKSKKHLKYINDT
jgi:hypothetical protein